MRNAECGVRNGEWGMGKMEPRMDADCRELGRWEWGKGIGREDGGGFGEAGTRIWGIGWAVGNRRHAFRFLSAGGSLPRVGQKGWVEAGRRRNGS